MVEGFLEEAGLPTRDVVAGLSAEIGYVMGCFERGYGTEATVLRYRENLDSENHRAAILIRNFQATAGALVALERVTAARDRLSMTDRSRLATRGSVFAAKRLRRGLRPMPRLRPLPR